MITTLAALAILAAPVHAETALQGTHGGQAALDPYPIVAGEPGDPCALALTVTADGAASVESVGCSGPNELTLRAAVPSWTFVDVQPAEGRDSVALSLELRPITDPLGTTRLMLFDDNADGIPGGIVGGLQVAGTTLHGEHGGRVRLSAAPAFEVEHTAEPCTTQFGIAGDGSIELGSSDCSDKVAYDVVVGLGGLKVREVTLAEGQASVASKLHLRFVEEDDGNIAVSVADAHNPNPPAAVFTDADGDVPVVHWSEVKVKRRVSPKYPEDAKSMDLGTVRCQLRFLVDERGMPYDVRLESCPEAFHESALEAAWKWRFYPMKMNGEAVKAQFVLVIVYRLM